MIFSNTVTSCNIMQLLLYHVYVVLSSVCANKNNTSCPESWELLSGGVRKLQSLHINVININVFC